MLAYQPRGNKDDVGHVGRHVAFEQNIIAQDHMVVTT
jgi:hypothetical protein